MNSLEFINKHIEETDKQIKYLERRVVEDAIYESLVEFHKKEIETLTEIKQSLLQIKTELEAWEVVKNSISKEHLEDYQVRTMYGENPFMNINKKEKLIIQKALEVEDE